MRNDIVTTVDEGNINAMKAQLKRSVPPFMMPGNVGNLNDVVWPFWYQATIALGTNPTLASTTSVSATFQVSQEAGFLIMSISRKSAAYSTSGALGPLNVRIQDVQSTRQINDSPIPIQMIGNKSRPFVLPTPWLLMPNAVLQVTMSSWLASGTSQATTGSGNHQFTFFGYRVRVQDANKVLSTIFG